MEYKKMLSLQEKKAGRILKKVETLEKRINILLLKFEEKNPPCKILVLHNSDKTYDILQGGHLQLRGIVLLDDVEIEDNQLSE